MRRRVALAAGLALAVAPLALVAWIAAADRPHSHDRPPELEETYELLPAITAGLRRVGDALLALEGEIISRGGVRNVGS